MVKALVEKEEVKKTKTTKMMHHRRPNQLLVRLLKKRKTQLWLKVNVYFVRTILKFVIVITPSAIDNLTPRTIDHIANQFSNGNLLSAKIGGTTPFLTVSVFQNSIQSFTFFKNNANFN